MVMFLGKNEALLFTKSSCTDGKLMPQVN